MIDGGPIDAAVISGVVALAGSLFSFVDASLVTLGVARARAIEESEGGDAATAKRWLAQREKIRLRLLTVRVLAIVASAMLAARASELWSGGAWGLVLAGGLVALIYVSSAAVLTTVAQQHGHRVALLMLRLLRPLDLLLFPLTAPVARLGAVASRWFPRSDEPVGDEDMDRVAELEVEQAVEKGRLTGSIAPEEADLIRGVLEFGETTVRDIMLPRTSVAAIEIDTTIPDVMKFVAESGHSRYPVYRERIDQIVGVLFTKDLLRAMESSQGAPKSLSSVIKMPAFFASEKQRVGDLLREMRARRAHLAVVVDEFGGVSGIVTLEDILEQIVGDIQDEHDVTEQLVQEISPGCYSVDAKTPVEDLEKVLATRLTSDSEQPKFRSVGGLVVDAAGRVPGLGEKVDVGEYRFTVIDADRRRVRKVELQRFVAGVPPTT